MLESFAPNFLKISCTESPMNNKTLLEMGKETNGLNTFSPRKYFPNSKPCVKEVLPLGTVLLSYTPPAYLSHHFPIPIKSDFPFVLLFFVCHYRQNSFVFSLGRKKSRVEQKGAERSESRVEKQGISGTRNENKQREDNSWGNSR